MQRDHRRAQPSALRELVFALVEAGVFLKGEHGLVPDLARLEGGDLPIDLEDAIRARLARLDDLERVTIDRASILGEVVADRGLFAMMRSERAAAPPSSDPLGIWPDDEDELALVHALLRLEEKGFLEPIESALPGNREYRFVHGETRRFVYAHLSEEQRLSRHATVAHWITTSLDIEREGVAALAAPTSRRRMAVRAARAYLMAPSKSSASATPRPRCDTPTGDRVIADTSSRQAGGVARARLGAPRRSVATTMHSWRSARSSRRASASARVRAAPRDPIARIYARGR